MHSLLLKQEDNVVIIKREYNRMGLLRVSRC